MDERTPNDAIVIGLLLDGFGRVRESISLLLDNASAQLLSYRAGKDANHIAWLVWHLSRVQDDHFTHLAQALWPEEKLEQRWISAGWDTKFNLPYAQLATGYGQNSEQVAAFGNYNTDLLAGYHQDVHQLTEETLRKINVADLATIIDRRWNPPVNAGVRIISILNDITEHVGQAEYAAGLYGSR